jgi:hypothetical protein
MHMRKPIIGIPADRRLLNSHWFHCVGEKYINAVVQAADAVPVLGFLDDAIMIELCMRELQHEIEAYEDFVAYRSDEAGRRGVDVATLRTERVEWAEARRLELIDRMRKRRGQSYQNNGGWKPTLFSFRG